MPDEQDAKQTTQSLKDKSPATLDDVRETLARVEHAIGEPPNDALDPPYPGSGMWRSIAVLQRDLRARNATLGRHGRVSAGAGVAALAALVVEVVRIVNATPAPASPPRPPVPIVVDR
jgi:hypothetical protein